MSFFKNEKSWPLVPLKDIATLKRGYDLPTQERKEGVIPIYAANGQNGQHNEAKIKGPGVITGRSGTIGKVHYTKNDFWPLNTALYVMNFHGNDPKWVFYLLQAFKLERFVEGAGVPTLNRNLVHGELIPLPPLEEQKRIATILDKADAIRQKRQQTIALADDFLRSVFLDMFGDPVTNPKGWEIQPISKVAEVQGGLQVTKKREGLPVTCPYLRVANVYRGRLELSEIKTMQVTEIEQERVALVKNDILIVEGHGNKEEIGRCAMWDGSIENMVHQNHLIRVRVINNRVLPQYLTDFINSEGGRGQLIGASNTTSGLNTISTRLVKETAVLIPDLHIQERYIQIFKKVTETLNHFQQGTLEGKGFFESLSQKAFSGQL
ncbi:restriction endonuclease subunit S [Aeromonas media]|uniref:restriction endonuclease subunit S n=1 Tax=Aeromonas media TaxID=651 RepID=UPI003D01D784